MKCMVIFCKNKGNIPGMTYFMLTPRRHDTWMRALGRDPNIERLCEKNSVCYVHFRKEDMYVVNNKIRLKPDAFPQLNLRKPFIPTFQTINRSYRSDHRPIIKRSDMKLPVQRQHLGSMRLGTILQKCPPLTLSHIYSTLKGRDPTFISLNSTMYFCEDHFDMPNDMENYMEYHLMGSVSQIRMRPGCMPTRYQCQTYDAPERSYILKKQRKALIAERERESKERTIATKHVELGDNSYGSSGPSTSHVNVMPLAPFTRVPEKSPDSHQLSSTISSQTPLQLGYATPGKEKSMLKVKKLGKIADKEMNSEPNSVDVTKKPVVQSVELIPETSCQKPDGYLPECTRSSSRSEVITNTPTEKRNHSGEVFCRMCFEPIAERKTMVPLTILDVNFATESAIDKQKKIIQTYKITNMIEIIMPNFDFKTAYNPMACQKCVESAYSFIQGRVENEKIIKLYKSRHCPNAKSISCEDVAQSLLMKERKRKTPKKGDSTESMSGSLLEQTSSQLEQRGNSVLASDVSQAERPENVNSSSENLATETSMGLCKAIKCEIEDTGDYGDYGGNPHFPVKTEEMSCMVKEENAAKGEIAVKEAVAVKEEIAVEEEIFVKEEMSWDFTDITNNERTAQLDMDYHIKEEYCLRPDDLDITDIVYY